MKTHANSGPVKIRERKLGDGRKTLYLDIYFKGVRRYERLDLYLLPELTRADADENKRTLEQAERVRSLRLFEIHNDSYGLSKKKNGNVNFLQYAQMKIEQKPKTVYQNLRSAILWVYRFNGERDVLRIGEIKKGWVEEFVEFLEESELKPNTAHLYFERVKEMLGWAVRDEIIARNPADGVAPPKKEDSKREYLTVEELRRLADTPCRQDIARPFIFGCLTGLRISDVKALTWGDVEEEAGGVRLVFRQKKTKGLQYLYVNRQASELMGKRGANNRPVFHLPSITTYLHYLRDWVKAAGIKKHITSHCARHTFATLQITLGTDIYTVSSLLGHKNVRTTQVYAKVVDEKKQEAVNRIPDILGFEGGEK